MSIRLLCGFAAASVLLVGQQSEGDFVFRSDVALLRVDAQVIDRSNRALTGLAKEDFVLYEEGRPQEIKHFASEEMPVDVVLLLDVSGSMRTHVERIAAAADRALRVLGPDDRVAIMVFDRATRLRLPFRKSLEDVENGLDGVLNQETFDGGTDITRALHDAARYVAREARRDARRAIVILTDDQTERDRDEAGVARSLADAGAVLSALLAPDANRTGSWGTGYPGGLGGIILGRGRFPGPVIRAPRTQTAGTAEIARRSGGDSLRVDDASALEMTLSRLRQRYTLHYSLPEGVQPGQERDIQVALSERARRRYPDAEVRFRRVSIGEQPGAAAPAVISSSRPSRTQTAGEARRRPGVDERYGEPAAAARGGGWRRAETADTQPADPKLERRAPAPREPVVEAPPAPPEQRGGWRRVKPGEAP